jgi:phosphate transport system permease protein
MLSGNALVMPDSLSGSARVLTAHIALLFAGDFDSLEFRSIFASGLLLFLLSTIVVMLMRRMRVRHA